MKRTILLLLAAAVIGGMIMTSCTQNGDTASSDIESSSSGASSADVSTEPADTDNIALGCPYAYDCGFSVSGDKSLTALTDGDSSTAVTLKTNLKTSASADKTLTFTDWYGTAHTEVLDNTTIAVSVDFGFMAYIDKVSLMLDEYSGGKIRIFWSTDGYNFTYYLGEFDGAQGEWSADCGHIYAKAVMLVIKTEFGDETVLSEIKAYGSLTAKRELLSLGAAYEWEGTGLNQYADDGKKLTDGIRFTGDAAGVVAGKSSTEKDPLTQKTGSVITVDLGSVKNVSEVDFGAFLTASGTGGAADRIDVRFSADGNSWSDFGQSYIRTSSSGVRNCTKRYLVTRNHTVKARYIKIYTYASGMFFCDEISVYGSSGEVAEPDYGYVDKINRISCSDAAAYRTAALNGTEQPKLTDCVYTSSVKSVSGSNTVSVSLGGSRSVAGAAIVADGELTGLTLSLGGKAASGSFYTTSAAGYTTYYILLDERIDADSAVLSFTSPGAGIREVLVYDGTVQLPYVRGGFFQLPTSGASNQSSQNSDYSWYLQLKGMRDLGMEYVVIQYSTHHNASTTLINGANITAAGYKYTATYGSADVCGAVLDAAEKLGMKVWLGTIHDSDFTDQISNMNSYEAIVSDSYAIIKDISAMYGSHPAFGGYYLSDETCDQWLNMKGGVDAARYVYKCQSDYIRKLNPEALIMIAPAIWRSGTPSAGADNLYRLIVSDEEDGRPVVDIVAAQDCLGREQTLAVSDSAYQDYMSYAEEWARAVRRAGAEFWHDAEVFEITSTQKRYSDLVKSLALEAPMSGSIIVFDIPHYFSAYPMGTYNDLYDYYKRLIMLDYTVYYSGIRSYADANGDAASPEVITDDGKVVNTAAVKPVTPPKADTVYNEGFIVIGTPDAASASFADFASANGSGNKAAFAYYSDSSAFYALIKVNDATADYGKGVWWEGKDDLIQIWLTADGSSADDASAVEFGVRFYIHRTGSGSFETGGQAGSKSSFGGFDVSFADGIFMVKMPWNSLGRTAPTVGDGTAIGINIQYIDGSDGSWSSTTANNGRSIAKQEMYSF